MGVGVWELIFYFLRRVFGMFVKLGDVNWVYVTNCVSICICEESDGYVLCYLYIAGERFGS